MLGSGASVVCVCRVDGERSERRGGVKASVASLRDVGEPSEFTAGGLASSRRRRRIASLSYIPTVQYSKKRN